MAEVDLMHLDCFVDQRRESSSILIAGPDRFSQEKEVGLKVQEEEAAKRKSFLKVKLSLVVSTTFEFPAKTKFKILWIWYKIEKFFQNCKYSRHNLSNLPTF